jgi:hypothetical protein
LTEAHNKDALASNLLLPKKCSLRSASKAIVTPGMAGSAGVARNVAKSKQEGKLMNDIGAKLDELADMRAKIDTIRADYEKKRTEILKAVQAEIDALDAEFKPMIESSEATMTALETEIKEAVVGHGASVNGKSLIASYSRGRVTWDNAGIDSYSKDHPDVLKFRKEGQPFVTLRAAKG